MPRTLRPRPRLRQPARHPYRPPLWAAGRRNTPQLEFLPPLLDELEPEATPWPLTQLALAGAACLAALDLLCLLVFPPLVAPLYLLVVATCIATMVFELFVPHPPQEETP